MQSDGGHDNGNKGIPPIVVVVLVTVAIGVFWAFTRDVFVW